MKSGSLSNVPIMLGFTKEDGLLTTASLLKNPDVFQELRSGANMILASSILFKRKQFS
jgi:hypothetical protein